MYYHFVVCQVVVLTKLVLPHLYNTNKNLKPEIPIKSRDLSGSFL